MRNSNIFRSLSVATLILSCPHKDISFTVEVQRTKEELRTGLMHRDSLAEGAGMFFLFPRPHSIGMWMKNTKIPLDMIFFNENGRVLLIHENAEPYSLEQIGPVENTAYVLEIAAGSVAKQKISSACIALTQQFCRLSKGLARR